MDPYVNSINLRAQAREAIRVLDTDLRAMVNETEPERYQGLRAKRKRWHDLVEKAFKTAERDGTIGFMYPYLLCVGGDQRENRDNRSIWDVPDVDSPLLLRGEG